MQIPNLVTAVFFCPRVIAASLLLMGISLGGRGAFAVGLTYVDGDNGANGGNNLAPPANISFSDDPAETNDGLWSYRSDGGVANPGDIFKSVFEASGGNMPEDAPEITQTVSGLTPNTPYDVYVAYWQGAQSGHNWTVRAGFSSGSLTLFNANGPNTTYPAAVAGTPALYHEWTSAAPTNPVDQQFMFFEAGRKLLLGEIGTTMSSPAGLVSVVIDDLPTTGGMDSGSSGARSWFEGVAYVPAGTDVFIAPGDFDDNGSVGPADAHIFLVNLHTDVSAMNSLETYRLGDLNADRLINHADFVAFKDIYDAANGAGALTQFMASVPEPSSFLLAIGCVFLAITVHGRRRLRFVFQWAGTVRSATRLLSFGIAAGVVANVALAVPVTDWFAIAANTGAPSAKPSSNLNTASPVLGDGTASSAAQVALWSDIADPLDAEADATLDNGQRITLTGSATFTGIVSNMEQFRFGLFNDNSAPPFDAFGWGGYMASQSASGTGGALRAKNYDAATNFAQTGSGVNLQTAQDGDPFVDGTYSFSMAISRFENELSIDAILTDGTGFTQEWKSVIAAAPNFITFDFNRVGFLSGNPMAADRIEFHDIDVTVDAAEALTLQVFTAGPSAGTARIRNNSQVGFNIDYYEITSVAGSLNPTGWLSLDDQEGGDPETQGWDEAGGSDANVLSEINLQSTVVVAPSGSFNLGAAFTSGGTQDLRFFYGLADGTLARGIVEYVSASLTGDYNGNGTVDAADYAVWRNTLDQSVTPGTGADGDGNGIVQTADYNLWRANFGQTLGSAAGLGGSAAVPEPATLCMLAMAALLAAARHPYSVAGALGANC